MLRGIRRPTWHSVALKDKLRVFTTVGFPALQFNAVNKQFVATRKVPIADSHVLRNLPFVSVVREAKAVTRITNSDSLTWSTARPRAMRLVAAVCRGPQAGLRLGCVFEKRAQ